MNKPPIFDAEHYESLNKSRAAVVATLLSQLKEPLNLKTAIDIGCGLGYFSALLKSLAFDVTAVDGRQQNVEEASRRNAGITFQRCDAQSSELLQLGKFDLVFCFGLLYHLENPFLTIRYLREMTGKLLLVEGVIYPGEDPIMGLVDEGKTEDQGLNHVAFYPTESCLVKMLYRSGFSHVYRFQPLADHIEYRDTSRTRQVRTMLAASPVELATERLVALPEAVSPIAPWDAYGALPNRGLRGKIRSILK
ncbi:MAG TPA: class I SAM-dependent methyltransferase [Candidatus Dormibacteraeota bacterium]|nr:class I SAM-dependent methyltransferase [Candidatus Dormibacteraeota bacterium]